MGFVEKLIKRLCRYILREELRELRIDADLERYYKNKYKEELASKHCNDCATLKE